MVRAVVALLLLMAPSVAYADVRVALVIGNGDYAKVGGLTNPTRDAAAVETLLRVAKFDVVEVKRDLGVVAMRRALRDFSDRVRGADIAVVFYAGHGIEVNGANYLIPVDAVLERDIDVEDETVSLERIIQVLEQAKRLRLVILDACRDNPFVRSMKRTLTGRSIGRGLAKVEVLSSDTLVAFAAKAGSTAADGTGTNSPYTLALVKHLATPGLDLRLAFGRVRDDVLKVTANTQEPFVYGSLGGAEIALLPAVKPEVQPAAPAKVLDLPTEAERAWALAKDGKSIPALEALATRFKDTYYADLALLRIDELTKEATLSPRSAPQGQSKELPRKQADEGPPDPTKLAAGTKIEKPRGLDQFDGAWTITWTGGTTCARKIGSYVVRIKNGAIAGATSTGTAWSGSVAANGAVRWAGSNSYGPLNYSGVLRRGSGSGRFDNKDCEGRFAARRN